MAVPVPLVVDDDVPDEDVVADDDLPEAVLPEEVLPEDDLPDDLPEVEADDLPEEPFPVVAFELVLWTAVVPVDELETVVEVLLVLVVVDVEVAVIEAVDEVDIPPLAVLLREVPAAVEMDMPVAPVVELVWLAPVLEFDEVPVAHREGLESQFALVVLEDDELDFPHADTASTTARAQVIRTG